MNHCLLAPAGSVGWISVSELKAAAVICWDLQLHSEHPGLWRMGSLVLCGCIVGDAAKDSALAASAEMNASSAGPESSETWWNLKGYKLLISTRSCNFGCWNFNLLQGFINICNYRRKAICSAIIDKGSCSISGTELLISSGKVCLFFSEKYALKQ